MDIKLKPKGADTLGKTNEPCAAAVLVRAQGQQMRRRMMGEYEVKKDCFGYRGSCKCNALKQMFCITEKCKFYKTAERFERDRRKYPFTGSGE